jgi:hypothetical protein
MLYKLLTDCVSCSDGVVGYHVCFTRTRSRVRSSFRVPFFALIPVDRGKFGRVVKAVALGAILVRGRGSNPLACIIFFVGQSEEQMTEVLDLEGV